MSRVPQWTTRSALVFLVAAATLSAAVPARAADLAKLDSALKWAPADAMFFSTWLRNREQIEAVANSRAWAKLSSLPAFKAAHQWVADQLTQPDGGLAPVGTFFQEPENRQLLGLLGDLFSHEVFLCGGANWPEFVEILQEIQGANYTGRLMALLSGVARGQDLQQVQQQVVVQTLVENLKRLKVPELVLGFRISDDKRAEAQLKRLEELARGVPALKDRVKRARADGTGFLTLTLDGTMVPWEAFPLRDLVEKPADADELLKKLKALRLVLSAGVRDGYLLVFVAPSEEARTRFGTGPRLLDRPEFQRLAPFADRRLTSISYTSQTMQETIGTTQKDADNIVEWLSSFLPVDDLKPERRARLKKDLAELAQDLKAYLPKGGSSLSFTFLTDRGQEGYAYDWSEYPGAEQPRPLAILDHVGGDPVLAVAGRQTGTLASYLTCVKWLKTAHAYFEELILPNFANVREQYEALSKEFQPLLRRLDETTATLFLPALADGQYAFVLDAKLSSKQWLQLLPVLERPMPMFEPALVLGVTDAAMLRKAGMRYRETFNELFGKIRMLAPAVPELAIAAPEERKLAEGMLYSWPLPEGLGVDRQIAVTAGLSDRVAALAVSPGHARRLLAATPLKADRGPLADRKRPADSAVYFNFPALVGGLTPWIEMGVEMAGPALAGAVGVSGEKGIASIREQVRTALEVLTCIRGYSSRTYREGGSKVTHSEVVLRDL